MLGNPGSRVQPIRPARAPGRSQIAFSFTYPSTMLGPQCPPANQKKPRPRKRQNRSLPTAPPAVIEADAVGAGGARRQHRRPRPLRLRRRKQPHRHHWPKRPYRQPRLVRSRLRCRRFPDRPKPNCRLRPSARRLMKSVKWWRRSERPWTKWRRPWNWWNSPNAKSWPMSRNSILSAAHCGNCSGPAVSVRTKTKAAVLNLPLVVRPARWRRGKMVVIARSRLNVSSNDEDLC